MWCAGNAIHIVNGGTASAQNIGIMFYQWFDQHLWYIVLSIVVKSLTSKLTSCSSTVWYSRFLHVLDCDCDIIRFNTIYTKSFMLYIEERWHYLWLDSHMWCIISIRLYLGILCRFFCFRTALFVTTILSKSQDLLDDAKLSYISCLSWVSIQIFFHTWTLFCE